MLTLSANLAKTQFAHLLDAAQHEPVQIMRHKRPVGVMLSYRDYDAMQAFYAHRAMDTMDKVAMQAAANGLTAEKLDQLLADES